MVRSRLFPPLLVRSAFLVGVLEEHLGLHCGLVDYDDQHESEDRKAGAQQPDKRPGALGYRPSHVLPDQQPNGRHVFGRIQEQCAMNSNNKTAADTTVSVLGLFPPGGVMFPTDPPGKPPSEPRLWLARTRRSLL